MPAGEVLPGREDLPDLRGHGPGPAARGLTPAARGAEEVAVGEQSGPGARRGVRSAATTSEGLVIEIDRELCYGFADCVSTTPAVFELDDDEKAVVIDPNGAPRDDLVDAEENCPVNAITITDSKTGEIVFP